MTPLLALAALTGAASVGDPSWSDPDRARTIGLHALGVEGAPPAANEGRVVFLTTSRPGDPWFDAVSALALARRPAAVVPFDWERLGPAFAQIEEFDPHFVAVFTRPGELDANRHFDFLERASRLDADPFVDFAFGYLTAADPEEARALVETLLRAESVGLSRRVLEFGPGAANDRSGTGPHPAAPGFEFTRVTHRSAAWFLPEHGSRLAGNGAILATGHGSPEGVFRGLRAAHLRGGAIDLFPALFFAGPCYAGVTGRWFDPVGGRVRFREVDAADSFSLSLLARGASAVFAGLDPDRGETNAQELEALLVSGGALGEAVKSTYDDLVLGYRREPLSLIRYEQGRPAPQDDLLDTMLTGGASRVLLGDPTMRPFAASAGPAWRTRVESAADSLVVVAKPGPRLARRASFINVFHAGGSTARQVRLTVELDAEAESGLGALGEVTVLAEGRRVPVAFATAGFERFLGRTRLHLLAVLPESTVADGLVARFRFERSPIGTK